jgi:hypothetical protein
MAHAQAKLPPACAWAMTSRRRPIVQQLAAQIPWGYNGRIQQIEAELTRGAKPPPAPKKKPIGLRPEGR